MKYAIMIFNYAEDEQIFLGIKETKEVKNTIKKGIEELIEKNPNVVDFIGDIHVFVIAEDFSGDIDRFDDGISTLNDFFNSNKKACSFVLADICSISKVKVTI